MNENFIIDVDRVIQKYNEHNPELKQLSRKILADKLQVNPQVFSDWKSGKTPKIIMKLFKLMEIGQCTLDDFVVNPD